MTTQLTVWICPETLERSLYFDSLDDLRDGIEVVEDFFGPDRVEMDIMPESLPSDCPAVRHGRFVLTLDPDPRPMVCEPFCHYYANEPESMISIYWGEFESWIIIEFRNPDHCQWILSQLIAYGPLECQGPGDCPLVLVEVDAPGEIPENKADAHSGGGTTIYQVTQNQIVPGMKIQLTHFFYNGSNTERYDPDFIYYVSPCLTGGLITAVNGDYDDPNISFTVEVLGRTVTAYPSDFVTYEVGDWVYMVKTPGVTETCRDTARDPNDYFAPNLETPYTGQWTILPIEIGPYGPQEVLFP
jgi:hypothetical protein